MSTKAYAVLTALGPDRLGIVDDVSALIADRGGNIEESRMSHLGGEFAALALVSLPAEALEELLAGLPGHEVLLGLKLGLRPTQAPAQRATARPYVLEAVSLDMPGIVHAVASVVKAAGINIEELDTLTQPAPMTGAPMFRMRALILLGPQHSATKLKADLAALSLDSDLDLTLRPA